MKLHVKAYGVVPYIVKDEKIKILLCRSVASKDKWGCLKGTKNKDETAYECAKREFYEECSISVDIALFEDYFEQINIEKNVGVWLVNASNIDNLDRYFDKDSLKPEYLSWENCEVKFFSINKLPKIKSKQKDLLRQIKEFLLSKNLIK